jgi:hypothetical protein
MSQHDMCPICMKLFEEGDVVANYRVWSSLLPRSAHFRCLMILSTPDEKSKPPKGTTP